MVYTEVQNISVLKAPVTQAKKLVALRCLENLSLCKTTYFEERTFNVSFYMGVVGTNEGKGKTS